MNEKHVDELYSKYAESVPKKRRGALKESLIAADDSKYDDVLNTALPSKKSVKSFSWRIILIATVLGVFFIIFNLVAFMCINPLYAAYGGYAAKINDDLNVYLAQMDDKSDGTQNGTGEEDDASAGGKSSTENWQISDRLFVSDSYNAKFSAYETALNNLSAIRDELETEYEKYSADAVFTGNKTENYLNVKVELAKLKVPEEGTADYAEQKKAYDATKAELEKKIADYESRSAALQSQYEKVKSKTEEYRTAAPICEAAANELNDWINDVWIPCVHNTEEYKESLRSINVVYFFADNGVGLPAYLDKCNEDLNANLTLYRAASLSYARAKDTLEKSPALIEEDNLNIQAVGSNYNAAVAGFKNYVQSVVNYRNEYAGYVSSNAQDKAVNDKLITDLYAVLYDGENNEKEDGKIVSAATVLLETYKKSVDALSGAEDKNYALANGVYDKLNGALNEKPEGEIPAAVKKLFGQCSDWLSDYDGKISEYELSIANHNKVLSLFKLNGYADNLNKLIELNGKKEELNLAIEAETDEAKKQALQAQITAVDKAIETINKSIAEQEITVGLYQSIIDDDDWTADYYVQYCINNSENEDYAAVKSAYEILQNAAQTVGNAERIKFVTDDKTEAYAIGEQSKQNYNGAYAYFSAEKSAARLRTALNLSKELTEDVSEYYKKIENGSGEDGSSRYQWAYVSDGTRKNVHNKLSYQNHVTDFSAITKNLDKADVEGVMFETYDISGDKCEATLKAVENLKSDGKISAYKAAVADVENFRASAQASVSSYALTQDIISSVIMVYDIIVCVTAACYFIYAVCVYLNKDKRKNYDLLVKELENKN